MNLRATRAVSSPERALPHMLLVIAAYIRLDRKYYFLTLVAKACYRGLNAKVFVLASNLRK